MDNSVIKASVPSRRLLLCLIIAYFDLDHNTFLIGKMPALWTRQSRLNKNYIHRFSPLLWQIFVSKSACWRKRSLLLS